MTDGRKRLAVAEVIQRELVRVPGGEIELTDARKKRSWRATVDSFLLSSCPINEEEYEGVIGALEDGRGPSRLPVTNVSWFDCVEFCNRLSEMAGFSACYSRSETDVRCDFGADGFRLCTEAEWEHACRAGSNAPHYGPLDQIAWYGRNSESRAHEVGSLAPNDWGLYDMLGNVWEWCWDLLDPSEYGPYRVFRGGGWADHAWSCRASCRRGSHPTFRIDDLGFRVARTLG